MPNRRKPFSGKQKKEQLKQKRLKNQNTQQNLTESNKNSDSEELKKVNEQPVLKKDDKNYNRNRFLLHFVKDPKDEVEKRKQQSRLPISHKSEIEKEVEVGSIYPPDNEILIPQRPKWNYNMSKEQVEKNEEIEFKKYLSTLKSKEWGSKLSHFEHNIETWRQLWRVIERSDIVAIITDARFPILHFCPAFEEYVRKLVNKPMILVLNKIDVVAAEIVVGWKDYFSKRYPHIKVVIFTSFPKDVEQRTTVNNKVLTRTKRKKGGFIAYGGKNFLTACMELFPTKNFDEWKNKMNLESYEEEKYELNTAGGNISHTTLGAFKDLEGKWNDKSDDFLTIGLVGFPNVGKSSFLNGMMGRKVASVSKTPGHTKYFQTIFLTNNVVLCDCPGLVFPSMIDKQWQILSGIYPLSQVQEPYTSVGYLAERVDLIKILNLSTAALLEGESLSHVSEDHVWSPWDICSAWAIKRGFLNAKSGRPDVYRAASDILRLTLDGRIGIYFLPKDFNINKEKYLQDKETGKINFFLSLYSKYNKKELLELINQDNESSNESGETEEEDFDDYQINYGIRRNFDGLKVE